MVGKREVSIGTEVCSRGFARVTHPSILLGPHRSQPGLGGIVLSERNTTRRLPGFLSIALPYGGESCSGFQQ
jgi:hypothetical protein